jgi:hypothetical protein
VTYSATHFLCSDCAAPSVPENFFRKLHFALEKVSIYQIVSGSIPILNQILQTQILQSFHAVVFLVDFASWFIFM